MKKEKTSNSVEDAQLAKEYQETGSQRAFNRLYEKAKPPYPKHLRSDERFISYCAADHIRVHARSLAVKFANEYMLRFAWLEEVRKRLPWVVRRRSSLVAVTFVGNSLPPERVANLKRGELLRWRRLRVYWDHENYSNYYR